MAEEEEEEVELRVEEVLEVELTKDRDRGWGRTLDKARGEALGNSAALDDVTALELPVN